MTITLQTSRILCVQVEQDLSTMMTFSIFVKQSFHMVFAILFQFFVFICNVKIIL